MSHDATARHLLLRRGLRLEYTTLGWNIVGCVVLLAAAIAAHSVALAAFGIDSVIEIVASTVVIWQLNGIAHERREDTALRIIAAAFALLAFYVTAQVTVTLVGGSHPGDSALGIVWLVVTVALMFALAAGKRDTGTKLDNPVLLTEGRVTLVDGLLALAVLVGITLNAVAGWWWADPLSALVIVVYATREAVQAWREVG
jgi:divalent metal cation (Fe/Co/Zn/Cd) transporter